MSGAPALMTVNCPHCRERYRMLASYRGKTMRCLRCRELLNIEDADGPLPDGGAHDLAKDGPDPVR